MPRLELVSHPLCPFVQRAAIALAEKGVPFERTNVDLANKPDWFLALSPTGKVPLLRIDGEVLFESSVICEYLDETLLPRLHPDDALARAKERAFMEFASAILGDLWGYQTAKDEATFLAKAKELDAKLQRVEATLGEGPWFRGASFGLVDAAFAPAFRNFEVLDPIRDTGLFRDKPRVSRWRAALLARPSVIGTVPADFPALVRASLDRMGTYLGNVAKAG
jgi:glutathione S-transferase